MWSWACETQDSLCYERNWNSLGVCVHAAISARTLGTAFSPSEPSPGSCLYRETTSRPAETHTPLAGGSFGSHRQSFQGGLPRATEKTITFPASLLPSSTLKEKNKNKKTAAFPDLRTRLFGGFGKLIFDSCPISSCTDVGPIKETPESHFLLHISMCFSCKFFPTKYQARKLWVLKMSWFYGSILPSLSYIWYLRYKRPRF